MDQTTGASVGRTPVRSARGLEARRTFTETKNGFKTSEFIMRTASVTRRAGCSPPSSRPGTSSAAAWPSWEPASLTLPMKSRNSCV
jgi:hypothetical protein